MHLCLNKFVKLFNIIYSHINPLADPLKRSKYFRGAIVPNKVMKRKFSDASV